VKPRAIRLPQHHTLGTHQSCQMLIVITLIDQMVVSVGFVEFFSLFVDSGVYANAVLVDLTPHREHAKANGPHGVKGLIRRRPPGYP